MNKTITNDYILSDKFPFYLRQLYNEIQANDHKEMSKRVKCSSIIDSEFYKMLRNKIMTQLHRFNKPQNKHEEECLENALSYNTKLLEIKWLQKMGNNIYNLVAPASGPYIHKNDNTSYGSFIMHNCLPYLKLKKRVYDEAIKMFPNLADSLTKLLSINRLVPDRPDLPTLSVIDTRREEGLDAGPLNDLERDQLSLFVETILSDWNVELVESAKWLKKDSGLGCIDFIITSDAFYSDTLQNNEADGHTIVKKRQLEYVIDNYNDILTLLREGNLIELFSKHDILFLSRVIKRDHTEKKGKVRLNVHVDSYFTGDLIMAPANLNANLHLLKEINEDISFGDIYNFVLENEFQGQRVRATYGGEHKSLCYAVATTQSMRQSYKKSYPKVFKFGSDDYLLDIVNNARKNITKITNEPINLIAIDNVRFDHTPKLGYLATIFNVIMEKDEMTALILALQAICPVAIGYCGFSKIKNDTVKDVILGNPLDINTFFFGQGKSGDPDVADRCKILCAWNLSAVILNTLKLDYTKENLIKLLNHELSIAFLNLGDNNLILVPDSLLDKLKEQLANSTFLKAAIEEDAIFGGKLFSIEQDNSISLEKSPISLLDKLLTPEIPFGSHDNINDKVLNKKGWSVGMMMRWLEAEEQLSKFNKRSSIDILELLDNLWEEELRSKKLSDLAELYEPYFTEVEQQTADLYSRLYNSKEWEAKYLLLDMDSIHYKVDIDDMSDELKKIVFEDIGSRISNECEQQFINILKGGNNDHK